MRLWRGTKRRLHISSVIIILMVPIMEHSKCSSVHLGPGSVWTSLCFNTPSASFSRSDKKRGLNVIVEWLTSISFPSEKRLCSIQTAEKRSLSFHSVPAHYSPPRIHSLLSVIRKPHVNFTLTGSSLLPVTAAAHLATVTCSMKSVHLSEVPCDLRPEWAAPSGRGAPTSNGAKWVF